MPAKWPRPVKPASDGCRSLWKSPPPPIDILRPPQPRPLAGKRVLITAGPTHEPIDPVRYIANRSSGKQGFAIAAAAQAAGADVTLVSGPVELRDPAGVSVIRVESARDMLHRVEAALPADIAIFAAAVADWRVANEGEQKLKKTSAGMPPLQLVENPDILATISKLQDKRPPLVIGFAAETEHLIDNAKAKIARKGCDWIVANDVSPATGVMGGDRNTVHLLTREGARQHQVEFLARDDQGTGRDRTGGADRKNRGEEFVSATVKVDIRQLPHAEGLALPAYQSADAAGLDLLAAVPADTPLILPPGKYAMVPTGLTIALPPVMRRRSGRARACRQAWRHRSEFARHGGCGLSRRDQRAPDQPWRRAVSDQARRAHRANGDRAGDAGPTGRGDRAVGDRPRQRRFWFDRALSPSNHGFIFIKSARTKKF